MQAGYDFKQPLFVVSNCFHFPRFTVPFWKIATACGQQLFSFPIFHCASLESCFHFPLFTVPFWKAGSTSRLLLCVFLESCFQSSPFTVPVWKVISLSHLSLCLFGNRFPFPIFRWAFLEIGMFPTFHCVFLESCFHFPSFTVCLFGNQPLLVVTSIFHFPSLTVVYLGTYLTKV